MRNKYRWYPHSMAYGPGFNGNGEAMQKIGHVVSAEMRRLEDDGAAAIPEDHFLSPAEWRQHFRWPNRFTTNQCTSLMRYFIEELGPWVCRSWSAYVVALAACEPIEPMSSTPLARRLS